MPRSLFAIFVLLAPLAGASAQEGKSEARYEEILQKLADSLGQMTKTLALVVDEETAKENRAVLRMHAESFLTARKQSEELSPPSPDVKEKLAKKFRPEIEKNRKELVGQVARVQRVPGGNATLQEIRAVFEKKEP